MPIYNVLFKEIITLNKKTWNFLISKRKFFQLITRKEFIKNDLNFKIIYFFENNIKRFISSSDNLQNFKRNEKKLILNDDEYENNECLYIKDDKKIIIHKKEKKNNVNIEQISNIETNKDIVNNDIYENEKIIDNVDTIKNEKNINQNLNDNDILLKNKNDNLMKILTEEENIIIRKEKRFCDFLWTIVISGKGGNPNYKVRRSKKLKGEGYGGHGGNIILRSKKSIYDLIKIEQKIKGNDGEDYKENSRGKDGKDKIIDIPVGTIVRKRIYCNKKTVNNRKMYKSIFWYQFLKENEELLVARGGKGGISYSFFKKHDYRLPEKAEKTYLELELRLINDVAFIGIENSGKTSLCSSLSKYSGNITSDIYTTTIPHVSNINYVDGVQISILDTPFLFYNAHKNKDRGKRILRHLYRSKLIIYVIDVSSDKLKNIDDSIYKNDYDEDWYKSIKDNFYESIKEKINENYNDDDEINENYKKNEEIDKNLKKDKIEKYFLKDIIKNEINEKNDNENLNDYYNDTIKQIKMLRNELFKYNSDYLNKKELVVATKCDMLHKNSLLNLDSLYYRLKNIFPHMDVIGTSAKFGLGIKLLSKKIRELIYPEYVMQNSKWYSKNIEDYIVPNYKHYKKGKESLKNYELPDNIKHIYDHNYLENFNLFLKGNKNENIEKHIVKDEKNI